MSLWRQLARGMHALANRRVTDRELEDEVRHYLDEATAAHVARGLPPDEARRAARLELGNATVVREEIRSYGWENVVETLGADVRYAARRLRRSPGFTIVGAITLALGVGASTAIFGAVNPILFEPLPYPDSRRLAMIWYRGADGSRIDQAFGTYRELAERSRTMEAIAVLRVWQPTLLGATAPERLDGQRVSADYFRVLGVPPALGRAFRASDDRLGGPRVVILADGLWRRRFAGDPAIVGRQITLDGEPHEVIGVLPPNFENVLAPTAELWAPLQYDMSQSRAWGHHLRMVGRVRAGIGIARAREELDALARAPVPEFPRAEWAAAKQGFIVTSLREEVTRAVRPALLAVVGAVALVLVISCVNVTNLVLARGARGRAELAMRVALGAARGRLIRQLLTEGLVLAVVGGALGVLVATVGVRALVALSPAELPRVDAIRIDGAVLAFALGVTTLVGLAVGLIPALHAARSDLRADLERGSRRTAGAHLRARGVLVVAEVALALVLLVGAGLLLRSLERLLAVDPGFDPVRVLTMQVQTSGRRFDDDSAVHRFFGGALDAVRAVPGVAGAALTSQLPMSGDYDVYGVHLETRSVGGAFRYAVTPGYFEAMGLRLRRGRPLDRRDAGGAPPAVVVDESLARRAFGGGDPIGQRLRIGSPDRPWHTVVGVVADVKQTPAPTSEAGAVYVTTAQWPFVDRALWLVVRARGDALSVAPTLRSAIWSVDNAQPIVRVATMDARLAAAAADRRFALVVFEAFALVALVLAATGIYGVLAGGVAERTREIGVRAALGASRGRILALVVRQGMTLTGAGVVIGLVGAAAASRLIAALLFGVSRVDPLTYLAVIALLLGVSALACWVPAWRAARVDPTITLRAD